MKQTLATAILLSAANMAWASGGLSIDNVDQHTDANNRVMTQMERVEIYTQGNMPKPVAVMPVKIRDDSHTVDIEGLFNDLS